jgi:hypothetical protein
MRGGGILRGLEEGFGDVEEAFEPGAFRAVRLGSWKFLAMDFALMEFEPGFDLMARIVTLQFCESMHRLPPHH